MRKMIFSFDSNAMNIRRKRIHHMNALSWKNGLVSSARGAPWHVTCPCGSMVRLPARSIASLSAGVYDICSVPTSGNIGPHTPFALVNTILVADASPPPVFDAWTTELSGLENAEWARIAKTFR